MKTKVFFFIALAAVLVSGGCGRDSAPDQASERHKRNQAKLLELAFRRNACNDWMLSIPDRGHEVFTADLTKALVRTNGQAVSLLAELEDVSETNGIFTAQFFMLPFPPFTSRNYFSLNLALRCSTQQGEDLLKEKPEPDIAGMTFAVIAKVESVSRATGKVPPADEDESEAQGVCVDFVRLKAAVQK